MHSLFPDAVEIGSLFDDPCQVFPSLSPQTPTTSWSTTSPDMIPPTVSMSSVNPLWTPSSPTDTATLVPNHPKHKVHKPTPPSDTPTRRTINHRSAERRRRQSIKEGMRRLGLVLTEAAARCESLQAPHLRGFVGGKKPSKVQMLDAGIEHILLLQNAVVQLARENEQFKQRSSL